MLRRIGLLAVVLSVSLGAWGVVDQSVGAGPLALAPLRRVNIPYATTAAELQFAETAVFWLGRVTPTENYADVRMGYTSTDLYVRVQIFDRRLWYDEEPAPSSLIDWDSISLYLDKDGNVGSAPDASSYRFDAQLNAWEPRADWQAAYRGQAGSWVTLNQPFVTYNESKWDSPVVGGHNNDQNNRGWWLEYWIPWSSLGLSGPPATGTQWGLGVAVHDRDAYPGAMNADQIWPEAMQPLQPATWGQLRFGQPAYAPPMNLPRATATIRQGLNGAQVIDGTVGGDTNCGGDSAPDYFAGWGALTYPGIERVNVQNQSDIADWPCYSKYYVTFPLGSVPANKIIVSATLTLFQMGNPGGGVWGDPVPSYIQIFSIDQDWNEDTLSWNNAPRARENITGSWVDPLAAYPGYPGIPRTWRLDRAVAEAYAAGVPLRLAVYSADEAYHSGRYFYSSDVEVFNEVGRPTLNITWGDRTAEIKKSVQPTQAQTSERVTYTLSLIGTGSALTLTDNLPAGVSAPGVIQTIGGGSAAYTAHRVTWTGAPAAGSAVTVTFPVTVLAATSTAINNAASLSTATATFTSTAMLIVNGVSVWLPVLVR
ncbi:MAG: DNRLRE domain-containing protein [Chloroflexi bacterium]|nr:DNRLRE domain-containing protein [Chloroflexota bacterium]